MFLVVTQATGTHRKLSLTVYLYMQTHLNGMLLSTELLAHCNIIIYYFISLYCFMVLSHVFVYLCVSVYTSECPVESYIIFI